ncbi:MAG: hypothetical protein M3T56_19050, partial [Chloroflexota bacterium]|nr:hypothetical protein [Chloroflexota bacterium]
MIEDRELVDRLRGAIRAVRVPDQALDLRSRARRGVATLLAVPLTLVALVVALVIGQALLESRTERAAGTPGASNVKLSTVMQRAEAIGLVRGLTQNVGRVDRIEARLMTWAEYLAIAGSPRVISGDPSGLQIKGALGTTGDPSTRTVWVVAVAGEVWPSGRVPVWWGGPSPVANPTPYPPY